MKAMRITASNIDLNRIPLTAIANALRQGSKSIPFVPHREGIESLREVFLAIMSASNSERKDAITIANAKTRHSKMDVVRLTVDYPAGEIIVSTGGQLLGMHFEDKTTRGRMNDNTDVEVFWNPTIKNKGDFCTIYSLLQVAIVKYAGSKGLIVGFDTPGDAHKKIKPLHEGRQA